MKTNANVKTGIPKAESKGLEGKEQLMDMDEAIAHLKTTRPTFYRWLRSGKLKGMKVGRQWRFYKADLDRFLTGQAPQIDLLADVSPLITALREKVEGLPAPSENPSIAEAVELTIKAASLIRASDIHIAPQVKLGRKEQVGTIRVRVDGVLQPLLEFDIRLHRPLIAQWKTLAACDLNESFKPQDGRVVMALEGEDTDFGASSAPGVSGKALDLRVSFVPSALGEALTARVLDADSVRLDFGRLPFSPEAKSRIISSLKSSFGLVLCAGPSGNGKTTTLYSLLNYMNKPESKLISVEDPVEFLIPGVVQIPVRRDADVTFATAMRAVLRQDPDVILLGEIRDADALFVAAQAAITGHLVMSSLHTENAAAALKRMLDIGMPPFLVSDCVSIVIAQRLARVLCPKCKRPAKPSDALLATAERLANEGGLNWGKMEKSFCEPVGCSECRSFGYRGRTMLAEVLKMSHQIGVALRQGLPVEGLQEIAIKEGMTTIAADGVRRAAEGEISLEEALRVLSIR